MNLEDAKYIFLKERLKNDDKEAYKYMMFLEDCLKAERDINNKILIKIEKYRNIIKEKLGDVKDIDE